MVRDVVISFFHRPPCSPYLHIFSISLGTHHIALFDDSCSNRSFHPSTCHFSSPHLLCIYASCLRISANYLVLPSSSDIPSVRSLVCRSPYFSPRDNSRTVFDGNLGFSFCLGRSSWHLRSQLFSLSSLSTSCLALLTHNPRISSSCYRLPLRGNRWSFSEFPPFPILPTLSSVYGFLAGSPPTSS